MEVIDINPTGIYKDTIDFKSSSLMDVFLNNLSTSIVGLSEEMNVLDLPVFEDLKIQIQKHLKWYEDNICGFNDEMFLEITDSWYRETSPSNNHPTHNHPNSLLSGVVYLNVPVDSGNHAGINFETDHHIFKGFNFEYHSNKPNKYNVRTTYVPVKTGDIILFPSWIDHYVTPNESETDSRKIISFNTFLKGKISLNTFYPTTIHLR